MSRFPKRAAGTALIVIFALVLAACSSTGGKKAADKAGRRIGGARQHPPLHDRHDHARRAG